MKAVQKFKSFSDLKNAEQVTEKTTSFDEVKSFLELLRQCAVPIESNTHKNAK